MKPAFTWKLGTLKGSAASTFRSFNQSFVLADKVLYRLTDSSSESHFSVQPVAKFQAFLGEVAFVEVLYHITYLTFPPFVMFFLTKYLAFCRVLNGMDYYFYLLAIRKGYCNFLQCPTIMK